jgi:nucleotide-binding universal stress UspA family protein
MSTGRVAVKNGSANPVVRFERILVATDFSIGARAALDHALRIGQSFQSKVYLVHVIPTGLLRYVSPESSEEVVRQAKVFADMEMKRVIREAGCAGSVQEEVVSAEGVWVLLREFIQTHSIDLLVLGTHGRAGMNRQLLGPVAEEIFRLAECPVLTVGTPAEAAEPAHPAERRVLFATNFKPHSEHAAAYAYALEREHKAQMTVLHVVEDQQDSPTTGHTIVRDFMVNRMRRGMPLSCLGNCEPAFQVRFGDAGEQILQLAREEQSDLIVLGMRAGKDVAGRLPSAVAYRLVCKAPCPVLTIRH